ncbi:MAG: hypothetical protein HQ523_11950 [Lentisphaerae bacterium]|nr:hypothetical protein [Lentisphaerota bacterium]
MSAVSEWIVREYFEGVGYLVNQPRKHVTPGRHKEAEEEIDLLVLNPQVQEQLIPSHMVWTSADLAGIGRGIVAVRGWHTERFYTSTFEQSPDILRFVDDDALTFAHTMLGEGPLAKILCLPRLPASGDLKDQAIGLLQEKGIDGVISFETMLVELIARVDVNRNYEKSDLLQMIRILKNYELLKDSQLDFFEKRRKR